MPLICSQRVQRWLECNDAVVSEIEKETAFQQGYGNPDSGASAYLLMYRRTTAESAPLPATVPNSLVQLVQVGECVLERA